MDKANEPQEHHCGQQGCQARLFSENKTEACGDDRSSHEGSDPETRGKPAWDDAGDLMGNLKVFCAKGRERSCEKHGRPRNKPCPRRAMCCSPTLEKNTRYKNDESDNCRQRED